MASVTLPFDSPRAECNAMVDLTLIRLLNKVKVIHFDTNRFLIYDFL